MQCEHMTCHQCTDAEVTTLRTTLARLTAEVEAMRGELATVRDELAKCADAVSGYFNDGDSVSDTVQVVADALGHAKAAEHGLTAERDMWRGECASISAELDLPPGIRPAEGELRRMLDHSRALLAERDEARGLLDAADTTRREWEVRAATSYADGRKAGLREAAEMCDVVSRTGEQIAWVYAADTLARRIRALVSAAEPRLDLWHCDDCGHDHCGASMAGICVGCMCQRTTPAAEPRDEGEVSDG